MNALIFAAGLGTRLKPLTDHLPKALVKVAGMPLLEHTIERLVAAGATEIVVNVHHFGSQIIDYLAQRDWEIPVHISDERTQLLDTGGGLKKAAQLFTDKERPILIHNVDIFSNADLSNVYRFQEAADALLLVSQRPTKRYLLFDNEMRLKGWTNIETGEVRSPFRDLKLEEVHRYAFAGIHRFSPRLLPLMKEWDDKFSIIDFYLAICAKRDIRGLYAPELRLLDVGKLDALADAESFIRMKE